MALRGGPRQPGPRQEGIGQSPGAVGKARPFLQSQSPAADGGGQVTDRLARRCPPRREMGGVASSASQ